MANKVLLKKSSVAAKVPLTTDLDYGELALNYTDGKLYFKNASNVIKSFTIDDSVVTLTGTQTLTNKTLTSPTINGGALSGTFSGNTSLSGIVTFSGGDGTNSSVKLAGYNQRGGAGYHGFLEATNTFGSATNPSKYFRLNSTGALEIVNNAYTAIILSLSDSGVFSVPQISASNGTGTAGQVLQSTGTGMQWASAGGVGTVTSITAGTGLTGGTITSSGTIAIDTSVVTTLTGTQTLTNKTLTSPTLNTATANNLTLTGTLTAGASAGTSGQFLQSTGTGVQWASTGFSTHALEAEYGVTGISTSTTIYSFPIATYRAAKYFISVTNGTNYGVYEFMIAHDGTSVYFSGNNSDYVTSGTSVSYFAGDYVEQLTDENTRIEIGTMAHSFNWAISAGNLVFSAASTSGTISVKGTATLIRV